MKKVFVILAFLLLSGFAPISASAQNVTNEQLLVQINSLMQIVLSLMEQLKTIEAKQTASPVVSSTVQSSAPIVPIVGSAQVAPKTPKAIFGGEDNPDWIMLNKDNPYDPNKQQDKQTAWTSVTGYYSYWKKIPPDSLCAADFTRTPAYLEGCNAALSAIKALYPSQ